MTSHRFTLAVALFLAAGSAFAHGGHEAAGFAAGLAHPFTGLDHVLAMFAVGLYAATRREATGPMLPAAFVVAMLAGAALGAAGVALPFVEAGITASVLVFGLLVAGIVKLRPAAVLALVAVFAMLHGHAHQAEMGDGSILAYAAGFALATAGLHGGGYLLARRLPMSASGGRALPLLGRLIVGAGALLLGV